MSESINRKVARELSDAEIDMVQGGDLKFPITFGTVTHPDPPGAPPRPDAGFGDPTQQPDEDFGVDLQWPF